MPFDLGPTARLLGDLQAIHEAEPASGRRATLRRCIEQLERLGDYIHGLEHPKCEPGAWTTTASRAVAAARRGARRAGKRRA